MTSYDLTTRHWIRARTLDGSLEEFSLRSIFAEAPRIRALAGELPTQDAAILRLLLAIMQRSLESPRLRRGDNPTFWGDLWERRAALPRKAIGAYLDAWRSRFDLLDPERPFMQVADLRTAKGEDFGLERLIADVPSGEQFFTTRAGTGLESVEIAEAARWLVHCQAFDPSGIKSGAVGDPRVKGGKGYPIGCGWAGQLGLILVEGQNLAETLLLNLVFSQDVTTGIPVWEREHPHGPGIDHEHPEPDSLIDALVWQSRRIRLIGDEDRVNRVLICNGDPVTPHNRFTLEPFSGWRRSEPQEKKLKRSPVYMPRMHQPDRALWRGLEPLLATVIRTSGSGTPNQKSPPVLEWLAELRRTGALHPEHLIRLRAVGLAYGSNNSVVDALVDDTVRLHAAVLSDVDLRDAAIGAVRHADEAVRALANLAGDLARASGGEPTGPRARAHDLGYHVLDRAYRAWVVHLVTGCRTEDLLAAWDGQVAELLHPLAERLIQDAGTPAFIGRMVDVGGKRVLMDSGQAERSYRWRLREALPYLPQPTFVKETSMQTAPLDREPAGESTP